MKRTLKIGLTGGIGSGKSLVLRLLQEEGVPVLQSDRVGHSLLREKKFSRLLSKSFGKELLDSRGFIDRKKLAAAVFQDARKRKTLNRLMHPAIRATILRWVRRESLRKPGPKLVVVEVPLLFEGGFHRKFDGVLSVSSPRILRRQRLLKRGWNPAEILAREGAQWPQERKDRKADWVILNSGNQKELKYRVCEWLQQVGFFR
jgi:dephospho-CoA kinase